MSYDRFQTYLSFLGQIGTSGSGTDIWQFGLHLAIADTNVPVPPLPTSSELEDVYDLWATAHADSDLLICNGAVFTGVKAASLDTDGAYVSDPVIFEGTPVAGGNGIPTASPPQSTVVMSLRTGLTLGRANRGRVYLPWTSALINNTDGRMTTGQSAAAATRFGEFLTDLNALAAGWAGANDPVVCNMSRVGSGVTRAVTEVWVGNVTDTQRRRRNEIGETYAIEVL